jgi:hypothetical protein
VTHEMENLRKKNETQTQNTVEDNSSRWEQAEDRIAELEDKIEIKGKTVKGLFKNSLTPTKHQTWESWALKKEKRSKQKGFIIYSIK